MTPIDQDEVRMQIISIASGMIQGDVPLIEGARELCSLRLDIGTSESELFYPIIAFDSETDHYPVGAVRQHYSQEKLAELDREITAHLLEVRAEVVQSCESIVAAVE